MQICLTFATSTELFGDFFYGTSLVGQNYQYYVFYIDLQHILNWAVESGCARRILVRIIFESGYTNAETTLVGTALVTGGELCPTS